MIATFEPLYIELEVAGLESMMALVDSAGAPDTIPACIRCARNERK